MSFEILASAIGLSCTITVSGCEVCAYCRRYHKYTIFSELYVLLIWRNTLHSMNTYQFSTPAQPHSDEAPAAAEISRKTQVDTFDLVYTLYEACKYALTTCYAFQEVSEGRESPEMRALCLFSIATAISQMGGASADVDIEVGKTLATAVCQFDSADCVIWCLGGSSKLRELLLSDSLEIVVVQQQLTKPEMINGHACSMYTSHIAESCPILRLKHREAALQCLACRILNKAIPAPAKIENEQIKHTIESFWSRIDRVKKVLTWIDGHYVADESLATPYVLNYNPRHYPPEALRSNEDKSHGDYLETVRRSPMNDAVKRIVLDVNSFRRKNVPVTFEEFLRQGCLTDSPFSTWDTGEIRRKLIENRLPTSGHPYVLMHRIEAPLTTRDYPQQYFSVNDLIGILDRMHLSYVRRTPRAHLVKLAIDAGVVFGDQNSNGALPKQLPALIRKFAPYYLGQEYVLQKFTRNQNGSVQCKACNSSVHKDTALGHLYYHCYPPFDHGHDDGEGTFIHENTKVLLEGCSWKYASNLMPGDKVMAIDGMPAEVSEICTELMHTTKLREYSRHLLQDRKTAKPGDDGVIPTYGLIEWTGSLRQFSRGTTSQGLGPILSTNQHLAFLMKECGLDPDHAPAMAVILGLVLGDGSWGNPAIACDEKDADEVDWIICTLHAMGLNASASYDGKGTCKVIVHDFRGNRKYYKTESRFWALVHAVDILGPKSPDNPEHKRIPEWFLYEHVEIRCGLLAGMVMSDGSQSRHNRSEYSDLELKFGREEFDTVNFTTISRNLAEQTARLASSLGIGNSTRHYDAKDNYKGRHVRESWVIAMGDSKRNQPQNPLRFVCSKCVQPRKSLKFSSKQLLGLESGKIKLRGTPTGSEERCLKVVLKHQPNADPNVRFILLENLAAIRASVGNTMATSVPSECPQTVYESLSYKILLEKMRNCRASRILKTAKLPVGGPRTDGGVSTEADIKNNFEHRQRAALSDLMKLLNSNDELKQHSLLDVGNSESSPCSGAPDQDAVSTKPNQSTSSSNIRPFPGSPLSDPQSFPTAETGRNTTEGSAAPSSRAHSKATTSRKPETSRRPTVIGKAQNPINFYFKPKETAPFPVRQEVASSGEDASARHHDSVFPSTDSLNNSMTDVLPTDLEQRQRKLRDMHDLHSAGRSKRSRKESSPTEVEMREPDELELDLEESSPEEDASDSARSEEVVPNISDITLQVDNTAIPDMLHDVEGRGLNHLQEASVDRLRDGRLRVMLDTTRLDSGSLRQAIKTLERYEELLTRRLDKALRDFEICTQSQLDDFTTLHMLHTQRSTVSFLNLLPDPRNISDSRLKDYRIIARHNLRDDIELNQRRLDDVKHDADVCREILRNEQQA